MVPYGIVLRNLYLSHRFRMLFFGLLLSLIASPIVEPLGFETSVVEALLGINLIAAVLALEPGRVRRVALALLAVALVTRPAAAWMDENAVSVGSLTVWGVVALGAAASAIRFSLSGKSVGGEQIYAALSAYLLTGLFFGVLYWVLEQLMPNSISVGTAAVDDLRVTTTIYFSFVTLASLGYGDILPVSDPARGLATAEVIGGQLYLAVMVARLVSSWRQK